MMSSERNMEADIGIVGLAIMGRNLALNMADKGFRVCVFNRTTESENLLAEFLSNDAQGLSNIQGAFTYSELVNKIKKPRRILLMISAGNPVDEVIEQLVPLMEKDDIIVDGGNSERSDTTRRCRHLQTKGIRFLGVGISGGEMGARYGPSVMPGGDIEAWEKVKDVFESIAAKANGIPCCNWIGYDGKGRPVSCDGAGHFVKTIHNGIGYADMQLLAEAYHMMKEIFKMNTEEIADVFEKWNVDLSWRLLENSAEILRFKDANGDYLVEKIRDSAAQKGTGKWAVIEAVCGGVSAGVIVESVCARFVSGLKDDRVKASRFLVGPVRRSFTNEEKEALIDDIQKAVYASKIVLYSQGFALLQESFPRLFGCQLNCVDLAHTWRGGCVIQSIFLDHVKSAFQRNPSLSCLLMDNYFRDVLASAQTAWRQVAALAIYEGVPVPALSSALSYYDSFRCEKLPANLLQAQRDFYGSHTFELLEKPGVFLHADWHATSNNI